MITKNEDLQMKTIPNIFLTTPIVYAIHENYQIIVPVLRQCVMWVQVGSRCFYDDSNGILRSASLTHRMTVPMELLDREKGYTVCYREIYERKPYFSKSGEIERFSSSFRPIEHEPIHIYHIADAHNEVEAPVAAGKYFGDALDLLVLNGDIPNHSGKIEYFNTIHQIASELTNGEIPVVFSRGNHDTRGIYAENIEEHTPTNNGKSYFSFRLGSLWGLVLDCGEDKSDSHPEYGHTVCCEDFRRRETEFIRTVIQNAEQEYAAQGVRNRIVIVHTPFGERHEPPFDIEEETYAEWTQLLREYVKPQLMLCGHVHKCYVTNPGDERDFLGQTWPVVVASERGGDKPFVGGALILREDGCEVRFTDSNRFVKDTVDLSF